MQLTQKRLKDVLSYDEHTGLFVWINPSCKRLKSGDKAGSINDEGYVNLAVDRKRYKAHRLAFLYMTGRFPNQIDHINGVRSDNSWANLRECSHKENQQNRKKQINSTGKFIGVARHNQSGGWNANITVNGVSYTKFFKDECMAHEWRKTMKSKLHTFSPVDR